MKAFFHFTGCAVLALGALSGIAANAQDSPVGRWRTVDDATGKTKSIVSLSLKDGVLYGQVEKILDPDPANPQEICLKCTGDLKDKPITGLQFVWGMKSGGSQWEGGWILDPHSGSTYKCLMELQDGGKKLKVRGFLGVALLGRTQYWYRAE